MKEIKPLIKELNEKLEMPQPAKARFILEIALDMQDFYNHCIEKGKLTEEALKATKERFLPDKSTIYEIEDLHINP